MSLTGVDTQMDGIQLDVNVEAGSSVDSVRTDVAVYEYPTITATLLRQELDENFDNLLDANTTAIEVVECYVDGRFI